LRVVEGVGVQNAPDELPAHVLQAELEGGVLERGVVARLVGLPGDAVTDGSRLLVLPHVLGRDDPRAVAGPRGGHGVVEGLDEAVGEPDDGRGGAEGGGRHLPFFLHARPTSCHTPWTTPAGSLTPVSRGEMTDTWRPAGRALESCGVPGVASGMVRPP